MDSMITFTVKSRPTFVHSENKYECPVCGQILYNAIQTGCGHRVCEPCLQELLSRSDPVSCPVADKTCELLSWKNKTVFRDVCTRREVMGMLVYCSNRQSGCEEETKLKDLRGHERECEFAFIDCLNKEAGCQVVVTRGDMERHVATDCMYQPQECDKCGQRLPAVHMMRHVQEDCQEYEVACPHGCGLRKTRRAMSKYHEKSCPKKPIECQYRVMGCAHACAQDLMEEHTKMASAQHLEMTTRRLLQVDLERSQLSSQVQSLTNENDILNSRVQTLAKEKGDLEDRLSHQMNKMTEIERTLDEQQNRIVVVESSLAETAEQNKIEHCESEIFAIKESHRDAEDRIRDLESRQVASQPAQIEPMKKQIQAHERQIAVQEVRFAEIDLRFQILETASYDGILLWKIRDYSRRKQDAETRKTLSLYSQPFYTSRLGYKMCARVYLNGDGVGKNSHLSLFFVVMRGEYDALLPWPFRQKVTFMLLDQESGRRHMSDSFRPDPTSTSFKRPTSEMNVASGCPLFVPQTLLRNTSYCKDDTIFLKIIVDTTGLPEL